jgi:hypothetical protein
MANIQFGSNFLTNDEKENTARLAALIKLQAGMLRILRESRKQWSILQRYNIASETRLTQADSSPGLAGMN